MVYGALFDEVRCFMTSVAIDEANETGNSTYPRVHTTCCPLMNRRYLTQRSATSIKWSKSGWEVHHSCHGGSTFPQRSHHWQFSHSQATSEIAVHICSSLRTCYLPFIHGLPTDLNTIYAILILVEMEEKLGQPHILVTADCAIYSRAQQTFRNKPPRLDGKVTMRIGGMHLRMFSSQHWEALLAMPLNSGVYAQTMARHSLREQVSFWGNRDLKLVL